ncbi:hypothetical protein PF005_g11559 [Phytophthora fragariae]|uniref:Uncharacterized protein n=1 Tax=Phytophthora fragariae TaxID=53985 RepID=A0A6A3S6A9_9STRA|nr:hypothetical protein PF003_g28970 [Phytophthora fragariae]KAE8937381.1 hypothetical protein PF009_g12719 [Phytophthora fragariae]KAE9019227.1 hypothetical protein PF011_g5931 [Phytophthora fragariae]KAE9110735.1 hypothetical protein PF007_g11751 [Phytophthora fragariae]KAE9110812.1 hypothetical protein PF010_g11034 [Phytophthora fragariae]
MGDNAPPEFVWFRFESTDGTAIRQPEPVEMKEEMLVMHFQAAVHASYEVTCGHCGDGELKTFVGGGYLGKATKLLDVWKSNPWSEEKPLIVKVPSADGKRRGDDCNMTEDEDFPPRKKFASAQWKLLHHDCPTLTLDPSKMLVHIPWKVLEISGATFLEKDCDLQLHCRSEVVDEWREIQRNAVDTNAKVVICGAPGTGKTCAAFAFAFGAVDRDLWDIVWIHYASEFNVFRCYMVKGPQLWAGNAWNSQDLEALFFSPALEERRTILFYDGYNKQHPACHPALVCCHKWRSRDRITRRLVIVTSMVSLGKDERPDLYQRIDSRVELPGEKPNPWLAALEEPTTQVECDRGDSKCRRCAVPEGMNTDQSQQSGGQVTETLNVSVFKLLSWTIDEYRIAVREDDFFDSVERVLRDGKALGAAKTFYEDRVALVEKKFYVAGGSARMMFALTTTMAMDRWAKA